MSRSKSGPPPIFYIFVFLVLVGLGYGLFVKGQPTAQNSQNSQNAANSSPSSEQNPNGGNSNLNINQQMSLGDKILVTADTNPDKEAGIKALAAKDYATAVAKFQAALITKRNDPESLIYLNNAKAATQNPIKIALSIPIGNNLNVAQEMMRGVAQAQNEINEQGGIHGSLLQVEVVNDNNDPAMVQQIAAHLVKDTSILAVIGHNSTTATMAGAPIYQQGGLVMISPTSDAKELSGKGSYIFRTIPSGRFQADTLSRYGIEVEKLKKILICANSQSLYSKSFQEDFTSAILSDGGEIAQTVCDFSAANFNPDTVISQAVSEGADGIFLVPSVENLKSAIDAARANQGRLTMLSSSVMYTFQTIQQGQAAVNGMVLAVIWHPTAFAGNPFAAAATQLWGGPVNWRTALAYDAAKAIIEGLTQGENSRSSLQSRLANPSFSVQGATGNIRFLPSGDRNARSILVKIEPGPISGTGYDFVPLAK